MAELEDAPDLGSGFCEFESHLGYKLITNKMILKRLFIQLPLLIIVFALMVTLVTPLVYWIITGEYPMDTFDELVDEILYI